jgi:Phosphotransferase enzyme family
MRPSDPGHCDPRAVADGLVRAAGLGSARMLEPLAGGRNNRVYAVDLASGRRAVMKIYFRHPGDTRDRLRAEWRFLQHANQLAPGRVATPFACDEDAGAALHEYIDGARYLRADPLAVEAAGEFFSLVAAPGRADGLDPASEACFSITEHLATVERRVRRLAGTKIEGPHADEAHAFIAGHFEPAWRLVRTMVEANCVSLGVDPHAPLAAVDIVASPSDFGFHNAVRTSRGPVFIDFEYAGRDDPAKLVCDFFCQQAVPVPESLHESFQAATLDPLGLSHHRVRAKVLLDAYRVKWIAIMLNEFVPIDESRRVFSDDNNDRAARRLRQLDAARCSLGVIENNPIYQRN